MRFVQLSVNLAITFVKQVRASYKELVVASMGLVISLAILSNVAITTETHRSYFVEDFLAGNNSSITYRSKSKEPVDSVALGEIINETLQKHDLLRHVTDVRSQQSLYLGFSLLNANYWEISNIFEFWEYQGFQSLVDSYKTPESQIQPNLVGYQKGLLLIVDEEMSVPLSYDYQNLPSLNELVYLSKSISHGLVVTIPVEITGVVKIPDSYNLYYPIIVMTNVTAMYDDFIQQMTDLYRRNNIKAEMDYPTLEHNLYYDLNLRCLGALNPSDFLDRWVAYTNDQERRFFELRDYEIRIRTNFVDQLEEAESTSQATGLLLLMFALPTVVVGLFLVNYSFGLIRRAKLNRIGCLLVRGLSQTQLSAVLVGETLVSLVVSLVLGFCLSVPISVLAVNTTGFLAYELTRSPVLSLLPLVPFLVSSGLLVVVLTNLVKVIRLTRSTVFALEVEVVKEQVSPFWKRRYLDLFLLTTGLVLYGLLILSTGILGDVGPAYVFLMIFILLSPIFVSIGTLMLLSRLFPYVTLLASKYLWTHVGGLGAYALHGITLRKYETTRTFLLVAVTTAFLVSFISFPTNIASYENTVAYYHAGAEVNVRLAPHISLTNQTVDNVLQPISEELGSYTTITNWDIGQSKVFVVNTTSFPESAWMREEYSPNWRDNINRLAATNLSVLLPEFNLKKYGIEIGDEVPFESEILNHQLTVVGQFRYWPNFINWIPSEEGGYHPNLYPVMSYETFQFLRESLVHPTSSNDFDDPVINQVSSEIYISPVEGSNMTLISEAFLGDVRVTSVAIPSTSSEILEPPMGLVILGQVNSNVLFSIFLILLTTFFAGMLQVVERGKETATERALGMTPSQSLVLILVGSTWLFGTGLTAGLTAGIVFAWMYLLPFTLGVAVPPLVMVYPLHLIGGIMLFCLGGVFAFSTLPAFLSTQVEVTHLLKVE